MTDLSKVNNVSDGTNSVPYKVIREGKSVNICTKDGTFSMLESVFKEQFSSVDCNADLNYIFGFPMKATCLKLKNGIRIGLNDTLNSRKAGDANVQISVNGNETAISTYRAGYVGIDARNSSEDNIYFDNIFNSSVKLVKDAKDTAHNTIYNGKGEYSFLEIQ